MTEKGNGGKTLPAPVSSRILSALAHPLRVRILRTMAQGDASATMLSKTFGMPLSNVSYHLCKVLFEECELVAVVARHQRRGAEERVFTLRPEGRVAVAIVGFLSTATARLEAKPSREPGPCSWRSVAVDDAGRHEIAEMLRWLEESVAAIADRCADRRSGELHKLLVGAAAFDAEGAATGRGD
jgi:DNA-binding transcriptional ArsR family regulator